ncbi:hypothetical protein ColTof4_14414 [Colletotrichum tofieldiae]|nr:hypothetical protein ColTof4_14414 [Colletotrichum tofieldiae]
MWEVLVDAGGACEDVTLEDEPGKDAREFGLDFGVYEVEGGGNVDEVVRVAVSFGETMAGEVGGEEDFVVTVPRTI